MHGWSGGSARAAAPSGPRLPRSEDPGRSTGSRGKGDGQEGLPFLRPPAVTVKKLQKWMYKGRLLSLGMKGRARRTPPDGTGAQATASNLGSLKMRESQILSVPPDQRITLTGRMPCNQHANSLSLKVYRAGFGFRAKVMVLQTGTCPCQSECHVNGSLIRFPGYLGSYVLSFFAVFFFFFFDSGMRNLGVLSFLL